MSRRYATYDIAPLGVRFHLPVSGAEALLAGFASGIEILAAPRPAPRLIEVEGALLVNRAQTRCLYDRDGRRIASSEVVRQPDDPEPQPWPSLAELPSTKAEAELTEPVVFRSIFFKHWGHFLLESLSRLWATETHPERAKLASVFCPVWGETEIGGRYAEVLDHLGVRLLPQPPPGQSVRLAKVYLPTPSFQIGAFCHPLHLEAPRRLARKLLTAPARDPRPVYLSRTDPALVNHKFRRIDNELELEAALARRGVRIVHMQHLSLAEQIALMNSHRVFIGPFGSAFHNLLFSLEGRSISTFVLTGGWLPRDFIAIDRALGNCAHYLATLTRVANEGETKVVSIDIEATLAYLAAQGAI